MSDEETGVAEGDRCDRDKMYATFQSWALQNYGDSGKTKTLTVRKYERVVNILTGDESTTTDNSKFRFWVKAKGFRLGEPTKTDPTDGSNGGRRVLYVPCKNSVRQTLHIHNSGFDGDDKPADDNDDSDERDNVDDDDDDDDDDDERDDDNTDNNDGVGYEGDGDGDDEVVGDNKEK